MKSSQEILNTIMCYVNKSGKTSKECLISCDINTSFLTDWKNGKIKTPSYDKIVKLAEFLDIDISYLLTGKESILSLSNDEQELLSCYNKLPPKGKQRLIGRANMLMELYEEQAIVERVNTISLHCSDNRVSAGIGDELYDYEQWDTIDIVETKESRKADFMLKVDGNSMEPKFYDGDYVLVRQQPAVDIGQIGIFDVDGKGYIKKFDGDKLISLNPDYEDINLMGQEPRCFGLVLGTAELV